MVIQKGGSLRRAEQIPFLSEVRAMRPVPERSASDACLETTAPQLPRAVRWRHILILYGQPKSR